MFFCFLFFFSSSLFKIFPFVVWVVIFLPLLVVRSPLPSWLPPSSLLGWEDPSPSLLVLCPLLPPSLLVVWAVFPPLLVGGGRRGCPLSSSPLPAPLTHPSRLGGLPSPSCLRSPPPLSPFLFGLRVSLLLSWLWSPSPSLPFCWLGPPWLFWVSPQPCLWEVPYFASWPVSLLLFCWAVSPLPSWLGGLGSLFWVAVSSLPSWLTAQLTRARDTSRPTREGRPPNQKGAGGRGGTATNRWEGPLPPTTNEAKTKRKKEKKNNKKTEKTNRKRRKTDNR